MSGAEVPCPGCGGPLELEQEVCGRCGRPRDEREIESGREALQRREDERRRLPRRIATRLAAAACAAGLFAYRDVLARPFAAAWAGLEREYEKVREPVAGKPLSPAARELVNAIAPPRLSVPDEPRESAAPAAAPSPPAPPKAAAPRVAEAPSEPGEAPDALASVKTIYGVVFSLDTRAPVAGALVRFRSSSAVLGSATTGDDGRYRAKLADACAEPVTVTVEAAGYRAGQLEDGEPSYLQRTEEERRRSLEEISPSDLEAVPLRCRADASFVPLNLALVPDARR